MNRRTFVRFCVIQAMWWGAMAALPGYMAAFMLDGGVPQAEISFILAGNLLCSFIGSLFWGRRIDRTQSYRRHFQMGNIAVLVLGVLLYAAGGNTALLALLYGLHGFLVGFGATCLDSWVLASFPEKPDAGSRSRSFATLSYAVTMLSTGMLISALGYSIMPVLTTGMITVSALLTLRQPNANRIRPETGAARGRNDLRPLLQNRYWMMLLALVFLTGLAIAPLNNMKAVLMASVGGTTDMIGLDAFIGCMIQAPLLFFSGSIARLSRRFRLAVSVAMPLLYALLVMTARTPWMIMAGTICQNISFGIFYPTMREMTEHSVPERLRTQAHSMLDVSYGSLTGVLALTMSGWILTGADTRTMAAVSFMIQVIPVMMMAAVLLPKRKHAAA